MNALQDFDTDQVLESADAGDAGAAEEILQRHRQRLRSLLRTRLNSRLAGRLDPSDVVQDVLLTVHQRQDNYPQDRPSDLDEWPASWICVL